MRLAFLLPLLGLLALLLNACDLAVPGLAQPTTPPVIVVVTAGPANTQPTISALPSEAPTSAAAAPSEVATAIALPTDDAAAATDAPTATAIALPTDDTAAAPTVATAAGGGLCVGGSNSILGSDNATMTDAWTQALARRNIQLQITGSGSEAAIEAARAGACVDMLVLSEPLNAGQVSQLTDVGIDVGAPTIFAYDAVAFVTNRSNPAPALSLDQITDIVLGEATNWNQVGGAARPIQVLLRPGSGTTNYVFIEVANFEPFVTAPGEPFPPALAYSECGREGGNRACLDQVATTDGAFYWVTRSLVRGDGLRPIPIRGADGAPIDPTGLAFDLQSYPEQLVRPLYIYLLERTGGSADVELDAATFRAYLLSNPGQQTIVDQGFFAPE